MSPKELGLVDRGMRSIYFITTCLLVRFAFGYSDFNALLQLKKGFSKHPSGEVLISWDSKSLASDGCPRNWYGISCIDGNVDSITLNNVGLVGEFSFTAITSLTKLRNLSISNNQLSGSLNDVASIASLEYLDTSLNLFQGPLPSGLTSLNNLVLLNLSSNNFDGMVPSGFGNMKNLKYLDLHSNRFSGDIMGLVSELSSVMTLDLSFNSFDGLLDIGLGSSSFVSSIQYLNVSHNGLVGELFAHDGIPYFDSLEVFDASHNKLNGTVPSLDFVVSLRVLRLEGNSLSGSIPEGLLQDSSMMLSELDLSFNRLEGPVGSITSGTLRYLNLSSNNLSGPLPIKVGRCAVVDLSNNKLSGDFSRIQYWGNYVEVIHLSSNALTGSLPTETTRFLRLNSLRISNNSLEGTLPPTLGTYPELRAVDLSLNQLSGSLNPSLFNSTTLMELNLSGNQFSGPIPLRILSDIPPPINSNHLSLVSLDLSHNLLSGPLPEQLSKFHSMVYLDLSYNRFDGSVPEDLPGGLTRFNVSYNDLSGVVPENLQRFPDTAFHPGNSLLVFPNSPSEPDNGSMISRRHQSKKNNAIRISIIATLVGSAAILVLISLIMYYIRIHRKDHMKSSKGDTESKGSKYEGASPPSTSSLSPKSKKPSSSTTLTSIQNPVYSSQTELGNSDGVSSTGTVGHQDVGRPVLVRKDEPSYSPASLLSSSNPSASRARHPPDHVGVIRVGGSPDKLAGDLHIFDGSLVFTAEQLSHAPAEVIGKSCHGTLYRAALDSGHMLVVKRLKEGIAKGRKEFVREAKKLGNIRHPNLVSLQGYYWGSKEHERVIISSYISAPCLALYLQGSQLSSLPPFSLERRLQLVTDVARCLDYLHNERSIPHGNLKSTNILVDDERALLTDYSLHRLMTAVGTADQVLNAGALGYRPPEFITSAKPCPSLKSDVYAFGVILLELVTLRCSGEIVSANQGAVDLTDWVKMLARENRVSECFDKTVALSGDSSAGNNSVRVMENLMNVALRCILPASERPDIRSVFEDVSSITI